MNASIAARHTAGGGVTIVAFEATAPWFRPGSFAAATVDLESPKPRRVTAQLEVLDLDRIVGRSEQRFRLKGGHNLRHLLIKLPGSPRRGYCLRLTIEAGDEASCQASCVVEALDGWWQSPRHAALTDFSEAEAVAAGVRGLAPWHVTVIQFYDWMYRHYRYSPPRDEPFEDALGRHVSPAAVRVGIRESHRRGLAALAYGSVYGAEREYVDRHPGERVFDASGTPLSLGETFYLNDLRAGSNWRRRLLGEYAGACSRYGFDGIHMDTYGEPHEGVTDDRLPFRFQDLYPGLIAEADARLQALGGRRVLFNCVGGYPLEAVATTPAAAVYVELWRPAGRYKDVVSWIERARRLGEGRAVVIAAYISSLRAGWGDPGTRSAALEAVVLLSTVITAAGGYHQILAERDRALVDGYYPAALPMGEWAVGELQAVWRFSARYLQLLSDPALAEASSDGIALSDAAGETIPTSLTPIAGFVWLQVRRTSAGQTVISLVDLRAQLDDLWDDFRQAPAASEDWILRAPNSDRSWLAMSPWNDEGDPARLESDPTAGQAIRLPHFRRWLVLAASPHDGAAGA